jgi:capsular polysaccharide export protein
LNGSLLLRIPPFPGAKVPAFAAAPRAAGSARAARVLELLLKHRVGGTYWAARPALPASYVLVRSVDALGVASAMGPPV